MEEKILFWKTFENGRPLPYGEFSNFSRNPFSFEGIIYRTSEHFYQSRKFLENEHRYAVIDAESPKLAAEIGRQKHRPLRPDWEEIKVHVMMEALRLKFRAYPGIRNLLLSTGNVLIVEDSPYDSYWGRGPDGTGKNALGKCLMALRLEFENE